MKGRVVELVFTAGAWGYDAITDHGIWREQVAAALEHLPDASRARRVLDLGCGPGVSAFVLAELLPQADVLGIDLAAEMIRRARAHHTRRFPTLENVRFERQDAARLPYPDGSFELAFGHSFLYLVPDRAAVLAEVRRVLAPGGRLLLMEPHRGGNLARAALHGGRALRGRRALQERGARPHELARFGVAMVLWRLVSGMIGQLRAEDVVAWLGAAGFEGAYARPTLGGLGLHCHGQVPQRSPIIAPP